MKKKKILINAINLYKGGSKSISYYILNELGKLNDYKITVIAPKIIKRQIFLNKKHKIIYFTIQKK